MSITLNVFFSLKNYNVVEKSRRINPCLTIDRYVVLEMRREPKNISVVDLGITKGLWRGLEEEGKGGIIK